MLGLAGSAERASAARVEIEGDRFVYSAEKGEHNAISISGDADTFVIRDTVAINAVAPCTLIDTRHVRCPARGVKRLAVDADDEDDSVSIDNVTPPAAVVGGSGDDRITGGDGGDLLVGLSGNDVLAGRAGPDQLRGGPGDDTLAGGTGQDSIQTDTGADSLDGGPDVDRLSYADRYAPVVVTLDGVANDGYRGESDNVRPTVEEIHGGGADDLISGERPAASSDPGMQLMGEGGDDVLTGGLGDDIIDGGRGNDKLSGGPGPDTLTGGIGSDFIGGNEGNDQIDANDNAIDLLDCGAGDDSANLDALDDHPPSCEEDVPGGVPSGVSASSVPGWYEFTHETLSRRRGGRGIVAFQARKTGETRPRSVAIWLRLTFFTANQPRVGRRVSCLVTVVTLRRTPIMVRGVPRKARKVAIDVDTTRFHRSPGPGRSPCALAR